TALLVFVAGHAADRFERKRVVQICQLAEAATALFLAVSTFAGSLTVAQIFIATFVISIAGPALGGLAYVFAPSLPYFAIVAFWLVGAVLTGFIHTEKQEHAKPAATADDIFAGVRF